MRSGGRQESFKEAPSEAMVLPSPITVFLEATGGERGGGQEGRKVLAASGFFKKVFFFS